MQIVGNIKKDLENKEKEKKKGDDDKSDDDGDDGKGTKLKFKVPGLKMTSMKQGGSEAFIFGSNSNFDNGFHTDCFDEF